MLYETCKEQVLLCRTACCISIHFDHLLLRCKENIKLVNWSFISYVSLQFCTEMLQHVDWTLEAWFSFSQTVEKLASLTVTQKDEWLDLDFKFTGCLYERRAQEISHGRRNNILFLPFSFAKDIYPYPYLIDYTGTDFLPVGSVLICVFGLAIRASDEWNFPL